jgi:ABC-type nitrate/sulfonate/bicarbonate transport system substrate-binding protein
VAAAMLTPPASDQALVAGGVPLARAEDYVPNWPLTCGWTLRSWLVNHREIVVRFIRAWVAATDWLLAPENRAETIELVMTKEKLSESAAAEAYRKVVPKARISPAALNTVIELRKEMGVYPPPWEPAERFFDDSYWRQATGLSFK